jgi:endo-1,4-beta-D-glucanase Y
MLRIWKLPNMKQKIITISIIVIAVVLGLLAYNLYANKAKETNNSPQVFANSRMLLELWSRYKQNALEPTSLRTLDRSQDDITTSEGQSYTMMRAVWMDDMETFDKSWQWTKDNLQREDNLMSWKFGQKADNSYGILDEIGGQNTASDADQDIALALLMAAARWKNEGYQADANTVIKAIWKEEVVIINGKPVLAANDLEKNNPESIIVNPSYLAPYAYRIFAKADPANNWSALVDSSYEILFASTNSTLDKTSSAGLTPDWVRVNRTTGIVQPAPEFTSNYGYEAIRTPWRMALDWNWYKEPRAKQVLSNSSVLYEQYTNEDKLFAVYSHDGSPDVDYESAAMYGTAQAYFEVVHPDIADQYYTRKLVTYYSPDTQSYTSELAYYDDNWVWFGLALHNGYLTNLTEQINE